MAELLRTPGAHVLGVDPHIQLPNIQNTTLDDALKNADIVTLHCGLNDDTNGLLNAERLAALHKHTIIINTARTSLDVEFAARQVHDIWLD